MQNKSRHCERSEAIQPIRLLDRHVAALLAMTIISVSACTPTVQVQAPDKPIEINLNVTIEQHVKVEIEKDVKQAIAKNKDIF